MSMQHLLVGPSGFRRVSNTKIGLSGTPVYGSTLTRLDVVREPDPTSNPPAVDKASGNCPVSSGTVVAGYNGAAASTWNSLLACEGHHFTVTVVCDAANQVTDLNPVISADRASLTDVVTRLASDVSTIRELLERDAAPKIYQVVEVRHQERLHAGPPLYREPSPTRDTGVFPQDAAAGLPGVK